MNKYEERMREVKREEDELQFARFSNALALQIGLRLVQAAEQAGHMVTIDLTRGEQQLFHHALEGTSADNDDWIRRKNRVVRRFGHSSFYMGLYYKSLDTTIEEKSFLDTREYAPHGGAFPITIKGAGIVGTVTVSGLPQEEDHKLVVRVLREFCDAEHA
jgi:uncharacterized protein (UPF0303 family)